MARFKKKWEVLRRKQSLRGVHHQGRDFKFNRSGVFHLSDGAVAKDLQEQIGQDSLKDDVLVIPVSNHDPDGRQQSWGLHHLKSNWKEEIDWGK